MGQTADGYRIYIGETPVTVAITDRNRANMAFNMLSVMYDRGTDFTKDGKDIEWGQGIHLVDENGNDTELELDSEWYEPRERIFDDMVTEKYTVCTYDEDRNIVLFMSMTNNIAKAGEMQSMLTYGIDPSIDMSFNGHMINGGVYIINDNCEVQDDMLNENWATEVQEGMVAIDDGHDFADAVAQISGDDNQATL